MRQKYPKFTLCVRKCCLNENDICLGCFRSLDEILAWHHADDEQKQVIVQHSLQRKSAMQVSGLDGSNQA